MPRYEVQLSRTVTEYRLVYIDGDSLPAARRRALKIAQDEGDDDLLEGEDGGGWCDSRVGKPRIVTVTVT